MSVSLGPGDEIESDFGRGEIVAITDEWIIYKARGEEAAIHREKNAYWAPIDNLEEGKKDEMEGKAVEAPEGRDPNQPKGDA